jgi:hypothetical protein
VDAFESICSESFRKISVEIPPDAGKEFRVRLPRPRGGFEVR